MDLELLGAREPYTNSKIKIPGKKSEFSGIKPGWSFYFRVKLHEEMDIRGILSRKSKISIVQKNCMNES